MTQNNNVELWGFVWDVISGLSVAAWVVVPVLLRYVKPHWDQRTYARLTPSRKGAKVLRRLAKTVGKMRFWLRHDNEMIRSIRKKLFRLECEIMAEAFTYLAMHSDRDDERSSALRYLSQVEPEKMTYAEQIIKAVIEDRIASDEVVRVAKAALGELQSRRRMAQTS